MKAIEKIGGIVMVICVAAFVLFWIYALTLCAIGQGSRILYRGETAWGYGSISGAIIGGIFYNMRSLLNAATYVLKK